MVARTLRRVRSRLTRGRHREEGTWLMIAIGIFFVLIMPLLNRSPAGSSQIVFIAAGLGMVAIGVADYLPSRWRTGAVVLRIVWLLLCVVAGVALIISLVS
jgi:hypothetical protein